MLTILSNSSSIANLSSFLINFSVKIDTTKSTIVATIKPGTISYKSKIPPLNTFYTIATIAPDAILAIAPHLLTFLEYSENKITGPNAEPKPPQAKSTNANTVLF